MKNVLNVFLGKYNFCKWYGLIHSVYFNFKFKEVQGATIIWHDWSHMAKHAFTPAQIVAEVWAATCLILAALGLLLLLVAIMLDPKIEG